MPEAMLPAVVLILCSERGRSECAGPHGMSTARSTPLSMVPAPLATRRQTASTVSWRAAREHTFCHREHGMCTR
jgi:hypothetical protein